MGMMKHLCDVGGIEGKNKPAQQTARGASGQMAYEVIRPNAGQWKRREQRQVLERNQCARIRTENPAERHHREDLRIGKGMIDERRSFRKAQEVRHKEM